MQRGGGMDKTLVLAAGMMLVAGAASATPPEPSSASVSRQEFAMELVPLVRDWESRQVLHPTSGRSINTFVDLDPAARPLVVDLANRYHLFAEVPGLNGGQFRGSMPLNRMEAAAILNRLLKPLSKTEPTGGIPEFSDLDSGNRHRYADVFRYGVMEGFPDKSFRGYEPLTRSQLDDVLVKLKAITTKASPPPASASVHPGLEAFEPTFLGDR